MTDSIQINLPADVQPGDEMLLMIPADSPVVKAYQFIHECDDPMVIIVNEKYQYGDACFFCGKEDLKWGPLDHKPDCIWKIIHDPA